MQYSSPPTPNGHFRGPPHECWYCGGKLKKGAVKPERGNGCLIILVGLLLAPLIVGIPIAIYGIILSRRKEKFWQCKKCGSKFPRISRWYEFG